MSVLSSRNLHALFDYMEKLITPEDLTALRELAPGFWENYKTNEAAWRTGNLTSALRISHLIQTIVDAKLRQYPRTGKNQTKNRKILELSFANGMPKKYLLEIAEILGIPEYKEAHQHEDYGDNRYAVAIAIMEAIGEKYP